MATPKPRSLPAFAALSILVYFFWLSGGGMHTAFSRDDLMHLYRSWLDPLPRILQENLVFCWYPQAYRPLGTLFYHVFFGLFGLNPLPYRLFLLAFLLANIYLVYALTRRLSGSARVAAAAALLHSFHPGFRPLYRDTAACFDIFCFTFYTGALLYYVRIRRQGRLLRPLEQGCFLALSILALNAKETAATLPLAVGIYEALYHRPAWQGPRRAISWLAREGRMALCGAAIVLAFLAGKWFAPQGLGRLLEQSGWKAGVADVFGGWRLAAILVLSLLAAWRIGPAHFRFALLFWVTALLPAAFLSNRGVEAAYPPAVGADICIATVLAGAWEWLRRKLRVGAGARAAWIGFAVLLAVLAGIYGPGGATVSDGLAEQSAQITSVIHQMRALLPAPRRGARILFVKDPFAEPNPWDAGTTFVARLLYRDNEIRVDRGDAGQHPTTTH